ncbi:uncharacterized protein LOC132830553 isoform X2 [Hemiscyllium ocellatum]|uniref:uncharacterized protein LOC132830553 isoform X2 n=1 Tax=Hemiscyllium ocellatum TaxID=170820 RepID=UPI002966D10A|nr:uncharacterized protein LOC132830553 isoform X2 [Hemiscyllium ocellatum]
MAAGRLWHRLDNVMTSGLPRPRPAEPCPHPLPLRWFIGSMTIGSRHSRNYCHSNKLLEKWRRIRYTSKPRSSRNLQWLLNHLHRKRSQLETPLRMCRRPRICHP